MSNKTSLPEENREDYPMADGLLDYFPNALAYVAYISKLGSEKHNPGQPMHWNRSKSTDHLNKIVRHTVDAGRLDSDCVRHSGNLAWRALANLQVELEKELGYPLPRNARYEDKDEPLPAPPPPEGRIPVGRRYLGNSGRLYTKGRAYGCNSDGKVLADDGLWYRPATAGRYSNWELIFEGEE